MALQDLLKDPLDLSQPDAQLFVERVQGNILKGHDRNHAAQIFVAFNPDSASARAWIAGPMSDRLTTAKKQDKQTSQWKAARDSGEPFFAFFLSCDGYVRLGIPDANTPRDAYFRAGMKSAPAGAQTVVADPHRRRVAAAEIDRWSECRPVRRTEIQIHPRPHRVTSKARPADCKRSSGRMSPRMQQTR